MKNLIQGRLFDFEEGIRKRDEALDLVSDHNGRWLASCIQEAAYFAANHESFTGEDIRFHCCKVIGHPQHHNAWGALINHLIKKGIISATGDYRPMRAVDSHARSTPIYKGFWKRA